MKYTLQRKKKIYEPALHNPKWVFSKLKEEREIKNYNNRIKQNLNYRETKKNHKSIMGELKTCNNNSCKKDIREIKTTTRKQWIINKKHNPNRTKQETQTR